MGLEEIEAEIVKQLRVILESEARLAEIQRHQAIIQNELIDMKGYYTLRTAMSIREHNDGVNREIEFIKRQWTPAADAIDVAYREISHLIPKTLNGVDIGFDVDGHRFHVMRYSDGSMRITHQEIE